MNEHSTITVRLAGVLIAVFFILGLLVGARIQPTPCAPYHEVREHGTACVVDSPTNGPHIEYNPEEP